MLSALGLMGCMVLVSCQPSSTLMFNSSGQVVKPVDAYKIQLHAPIKAPVVYQNRPFSQMTNHGAVTGVGIQTQEAKAFHRLMLVEYAKYPPSLLSTTRTVTAIYLCTNLAFAGQYRTAVPEFATRALYFDVMRGKHSKYYQKRVLHHELYHMIDWLDDYKVYQDDQWKQLNHKQFTYGRGGKYVQHDPTMGLVQNKTPGFLTRYSMQGVEEDKAELFSFMMMDPQLVRRRITQDAILRAKVNRLKQLMEKYDANFNAAYWKTFGL